MIRDRQFLAVALTAMVAAGCGTRPAMKLNHAEVRGLSLGFPPRTTVVVTIVIDAYNPNAFEVALRSVQGTAVLAKRHNVPIDYRAQADGVRLPGKATSAVRIPVVLPADLVTTLLQKSRNDPTIAYRVTGHANVTAAGEIERDDCEINDTGALSREELRVAAATAR